MVKARRPSLGLGHLPVWLHPPQEPTVPLFLFQILSSPPFAFRRVRPEPIPPREGGYR
jgi:hypothetical protein